jgi:hypothetical protein
MITEKLIFYTFIQSYHSLPIVTNHSLFSSEVFGMDQKALPQTSTKVSHELVGIILNTVILENDKATMLTKLFPRIEPCVSTPDFSKFLRNLKITSVDIIVNVFRVFYNMPSTPSMNIRQYLKYLLFICGVEESHKRSLYLIQGHINKITPTPDWEDIPDILSYFQLKGKRY